MMRKVKNIVAILFCFLMAVSPGCGIIKPAYTDYPLPETTSSEEDASVGAETSDEIEREIIDSIKEESSSSEITEPEDESSDGSGAQVSSEEAEAAPDDETQTETSEEETEPTYQITDVDPYTRYSQTSLNVWAEPNANAQRLFVLSLNEEVTVSKEVELNL